MPVGHTHILGTIKIKAETVSLGLKQGCTTCSCAHVI